MSKTVYGPDGLPIYEGFVRRLMFEQCAIKLKTGDGFGVSNFSDEKCRAIVAYARWYGFLSEDFLRHRAGHMRGAFAAEALASSPWLCEGEPN
jgi:hypothetical protein